MQCKFYLRPQSVNQIYMFCCYHALYLQKKKRKKNEIEGNQLKSLTRLLQSKLYNIHFNNDFSIIISGVFFMDSE